MIKYCLFLLLLFPVVSRAQELITSAYYPFAALAVNSEMTLADPMALDQSPGTDYKVERRFRMELVYNRNNHTDRVIATKWKLTVTVQNTVSLQSESLVLEFTPSGDAIYTAWADFTGNVTSMNWKVTSITVQGYGGGTPTLSDLPLQDIHMEAMVFNDRLVNLSTTASKLSLNSNILSWDYVPGAVEYDVEWVFIGEDDDFTYNSGAPQAPFDFKEPVRITTFRHHHELDLIYPKGDLYFRVRPKGYQFRTGNKEVYYNGNWSYAKKSGSGNMTLAITSDFEELKNWSYTVAYAENGMSMSQITYYDGSLRARQQLTRMKSTGQVVAAGSLYDYEGRQTVQVIPTPVNANSISYYSHLHKDAGGGDFDKSDFDLGTTTPMGTGAGAGRYYSSSNDLTSDPFRDRIPDAEGYPYVQTEFTNDNTGRLKRSSGVGYAHRLGGGHETMYFYVKPTERDLRELFGKNVGDVSHYDKQVVVDPNGQASVTYTDQFGRVIASGLMGAAPSSLMPLDNNPGGTPVSTTADLMSMNQIINTNGSLESVTDYHHLNMGTNSVTLKYDMLSGGINSAEAIFGTEGCASCFYELELKVYDPNGNLVNINYTSQTLGGSPMSYIYEKYSGSSLNCNNPSFDPTLTPINHSVSLTQSGVYRIVKILRVDQAAVAAWMATNGTTLPGAPDLELITNEYLSNIITSGCGFDCDAYFEQECREDLGYPITGVLSTAARDSVDACIESKCIASMDEITNTEVPEADECNMIRGMFEQDLSPGGWVFEEDLAWRATTSNWDMDYPTGGTPFNPSSWEDLINNWQPEWSETLFLAGKHPENCHHEKCVDLAAIKEYIQELHGVTTMTAAESGLYLNTGANRDFWGSNDPLSSDPLYSTAFATWLNTINSNYNGSGDNIFEAVNDLIAANPGLVAGAPVLNDRKWELMRSLYLGAREQFIEDNYNYSCNPPYYPHPSAHFVNPAEALDPYGESFPAENCGDICANNVSYWMNRIEEECPSLDSVELLNIQGHLQNYCITDCDGLANVAGAIQISDLSSNADLLAVDDILDHYCDFNLISLAQDDTCDVRDTVVLNNVNVTSLEFDKNIQMLWSVAEPDASYLTFITQPAITGISGYASKFPLAHWQSGMQIKLTNLGTSTNTVYDISDIASIASLGTTISGYLIDVHVRVTLLDGSEHLHTIDQFSLSEDHLTGWSVFDIDSIAGKVTVEYTICADTTSPLDTDFSLENWIEDCVDDIEEEATTLAEVLYAELLENFLNDAAYSFSANCFGDGLSEQFSISYSKCEYAFTLYYYDQAGNLVQTVPPQGVHIVPAAGFNASGVWNGTTQPAHLMTSNYLFNAFNQPREMKTPDGGNTRFAYNRNQQLRASQNAQQQYEETQPSPVYKCNYLKYDALGRVVEAGLVATAWSNVSPDIPTWPVAGLGAPFEPGTYPLSEVTRTSYHKQNLSLDVALGWSPKELNNRVASVAFYDQMTTPAPVTYTNAIFYDYDIQGNVKRLLTDLNGTLGTQRYKTVDYEYDLYSGKVNRVVYQKEKEDQFIHRYVYDDDNRLTGVETSRDGIQWDNDASYYYYLHGPLARTELGEDKVQGTDYAYTVHGWLKGVNSNTLTARRDMGHDGSAQNLGNKWTAQDAMGFSLTYYNNGSTEQDYKPIVTPTADANWLAANESVILSSGDGRLFNGNIRMMVTAILKTDNTQLGVVARQYRYDQFQRLKEAKTWSATNLLANNSWTGAAPSASNAHLSQYSYDLNGNITALMRRGQSGGMDNLTYTYYNALSGLPNQNNKLEKVTDTYPSINYSDDLETQNPNNYLYDAAGRLTADASEGITITWTAQNKVKKIDKATGADVEFVYDALGRRVCKMVTNGATITRTWYALDAQGEVMATYTQTGASPSTTMLDEFQIYGSQRLGTRPVGTTLAATPNFNYISEDNKASAIIELKLSTFTNGQTVQYKLDNAGVLTNLNATTHTWNTTQTIETNVAALMKLINANSIATDVTASLWWSNNAAGTLYMKLEFLQPGNWQGQTLKIYVNGANSVAAGHLPKRVLGFGTSKGSVVYGAKRYELANHLGNVLAVISDRKWGIDDGIYNTSTGVKTSSTPDGQTDYYFPTVVMYADYDPFGTQQDGRKLNTTSYKYGFQGQEADNEIKLEGNSWNYEYRMHDPRIGRFFAIDPLAPKYPFYSPYAFSGNRVIDCVELEGLEPQDANGKPIAADKGKAWYEGTDGSFEQFEPGAGVNGPPTTVDGNNIILYYEIPGTATPMPADQFANDYGIEYDPVTGYPIQMPDLAPTPGGRDFDSEKFVLQLGAAIGAGAAATIGIVFALPVIGVAAVESAAILSTTTTTVSGTTGMLTTTTIGGSMVLGTGAYTTLSEGYVGSSLAKTAIDASLQGAVNGVNKIDFADSWANGWLPLGASSIVSGAVDYTPFAPTEERIQTVFDKKTFNDVIKDATLNYTLGSFGSSAETLLSQPVRQLGAPQLSPLFQIPIGLGSEMTKRKIQGQ